MPSAWLGTFTGTPWSSSTLAQYGAARAASRVQGMQSAQPCTAKEWLRRNRTVEDWCCHPACPRSDCEGKEAEAGCWNRLGSVPNQYVENVDTGNHWHTSAPSKRKTRPFVQWPHLASHKWDGLTIISSAVQSDCHTTVLMGNAWVNGLMQRTFYRKPESLQEKLGRI